MRYKFFFLGTLLLYILAYATYSSSQLMVGSAVGVVLTPTGERALLMALPALQQAFRPGTDYTLVGIAVTILALLAISGLCSLIGTLSIETIAQRLEVNSREEL